jgi:hypothetical protein
MSNIFISYRRADTAGYTGRLYDELSRHFGAERIFRDVDTLQPGVDFAKAIARVLDTCRVLLAVIGPSWLTIASDGRRRLDDASDLVRIEIATALKRDVAVIPVLVQGASMPRSRDLPKALRGVARRNALELSDSRWQFDADRLIAAIEQIAGLTPPAAPDSGDAQADDSTGSTSARDSSIHGVSILDRASVQGSQISIQVGHSLEQSRERRQ